MSKTNRRNPHRPHHPPAPRRAAHRANLLRRAEAVTTPISRRGLLRGLSAGALALTLPVWRRFESTARAQSAPSAKRFIAFFTPNGTVKDSFFPADGASPTSSPILAPLRPFESRLNVVRGVHMDSVIGDGKPGGPHMKGPGGMLTGGWLLEGSFTGAGGPAGYANRISVDQHIANHIGGATAFKSLEYGVDMRGQEPLRYISYRGSNQPNPAIDDPWAIYRRVFENFVPGDGDGEQRLRRDQAVLDFAKSELRTLEDRLPAEDRQRLQAHLESVRAMERQLEVPVECTIPDIGAPIDIKADDNFPIIGKLQMDLMFQALACGLTNVSTFMWSNADSWQRMPWLGITGEHHGLSHNSDADSIRKLVDINTWYAEQIAYFLGLLDSVPEGNGTMLDNSVVLWGNEIGQGRNHTHRDIPWVVAGSGGGHFRTGRLVQFDDQPHNNLLLSMVHAFGMESESSFGAPEHCTGPLDALRS